MTNRTKGIILVLSASICFSLGGLLTKLVPWNPVAITGARSIFACMLTTVTFIISKRKPIVNKTTITGGFIVFLNMFLYVLANKLTSAANTIVLEYSAPIFIIFLDFLVFKIKPTKIDLGVTLSVLVGIVIFFIDSLGSGRLTGDIVAVISGLVYAFVILNNSFKGGDGVSSNLFGQIIAIIVGVPFILKETVFTSDVLIVVAIMGIVQTGMGYFLLAEGSKRCNPLTASLVACVEPILNPLLVAVFYHEYMSYLSIIGAIIVIGSVVVYNVLSNSKA